MSETYRPTMALRWVEHSGLRDDNVPRAMIPGWPENGPTYYKLQQWWQNTVAPGPVGEWRDVEIDHS